MRGPVDFIRLTFKGLLFDVNEDVFEIVVSGRENLLGIVIELPERPLRRGVLSRYSLRPCVNSIRSSSSSSVVREDPAEFPFDPWPFARRDGLIEEGFEFGLE